MKINDEIKQIINNNNVVLFMKGTPDFPQCGFSGRVVQILQKCNIEFTGVNILENPEMREAIKVYSNWPTLPQLYIKGQFVGGCDIVTELYNSGELEKMLVVG